MPNPSSRGQLSRYTSLGEISFILILILEIFFVQVAINSDKRGVTTCQQIKEQKMSRKINKEIARVTLQVYIPFNFVACGLEDKQIEYTDQSPFSVNRYP